MANAFRRSDELEGPERRYPLELLLCGGCSLFQLLFSVSPELLFSEYPYFSSVIPALVSHASVLSSRLVEEESLGEGSLVVEIASNDGYLLQHYRDAGIPVLGIEPARNVAIVAEGRGIPTRTAFFGRELGEQLAREGVRPDLVHAHNVLAHVPDLNGFVAGLAALLRSGGRGVIEVPYVKDMLDRVEFDTIYHEHLCYFSLTALDGLFGRHGLAVERVERIAIHGGSLRVFVRAREFAKVEPSVAGLLAEEEEWGVSSAEPYIQFSDDIEAMKSELQAVLRRLKDEGATIAGYGAAAKASTLLNTFGIGSETLDFVADASPHKQGMHMPGNALPILAPEALQQRRPDYTLLLAWNFADEILEQQHAYRELGGRFIIPIPEPKIV